MASKQEELDKLQRAIRDSEISLKSVESNIEQLDREINALTPRKAELQRNLDFHKRSETIPIAHEYKKTKSELSKVKARLSMITLDRNRASQAVKDIAVIIEKFKKNYEDLLKTSENNVLRVLFGASRGKK